MFWCPLVKGSKLPGNKAIFDIKITILKHGQQSEAGKRNVDNANTQEQQVYNPVVDFDEFKEEINGDNLFDYE